MSASEYLSQVEWEPVAVAVKVILFLAILVIGGIIIVRLYRNGKSCPCSHDHDSDENHIDIVDRKVVGMKAMFTVIKYGRRKFLVCINKDRVTYIGDVSDHGSNSFHNRRSYAKPYRSPEKI